MLVAFRPFVVFSKRKTMIRNDVRMHKKLLAYIIVSAFCDILYQTFLQIGTVAIRRIKNIIFKMQQKA